MKDSDLRPELNLVKPIKYEALMGMSANDIRFFDNSTIDTYRVCPRRAYYRHVRNFETTSLRLPLIFGSSWHGAMDFAWLNAKELQPASLVEGSNHAFNMIWDKSGINPEMVFDYYPRTPGRAAEMLKEYVKRYYDWLQRIEVLEVEQPFIVPIQFDNELLYYVGKLDKVFREFSRINICDHKTSSSFKDQWLQSFSPNGQMDGYLYGGNITYTEEFNGILIDGALVQKTNIDFIRVPVQRQIQQLEAWLWETIDWIDRIELDEQRLLEYRDSGKHSQFMPAFPKCTTSCTTYYGACPYLDLCKFLNNPEFSSVPNGFEEIKWEPFNIAVNAEGTFDITINQGE